MELIVWHRPLAWAELSQASAYLWGKLQNGTEEEPWAGRVWWVGGGIVGGDKKDTLTN